MLNAFSKAKVKANCKHYAEWKWLFLINLRNTWRLQVKKGDVEVIRLLEYHHPTRKIWHLAKSHFFSQILGVAKCTVTPCRRVCSGEGHAASSVLIWTLNSGARAQWKLSRVSATNTETNNIQTLRSPSLLLGRSRRNSLAWTLAFSLSALVTINKHNSPDCLLNIYIRSSAAIRAQLEQFFGLLYLPAGPAVWLTVRDSDGERRKNKTSIYSLRICLRPEL